MAHRFSAKNITKQHIKPTDAKALTDRWPRRVEERKALAPHGHNIPRTFPHRNLAGTEITFQMESTTNLIVAIRTLGCVLFIAPCGAGKKTPPRRGARVHGADVPPAGKTDVVCAAMAEMKATDPRSCLVIASESSRDQQWRAKVDAHIELGPRQVYVISAALCQQILNSGEGHKLYRWLTTTAFGLIVVDEAHATLPKTAEFVATRPLDTMALLVTGTPGLNTDCGEPKSALDADVQRKAMGYSRMLRIEVSKLADAIVQVTESDVGHALPTVVWGVLQPASMSLEDKVKAVKEQVELGPKTAIIGVKEGQDAEAVRKAFEGTGAKLPRPRSDATSTNKFRNTNTAIVWDESTTKWKDRAKRTQLIGRFRRLDSEHTELRVYKLADPPPAKRKRTAAGGESPANKAMRAEAPGGASAAEGEVAGILRELGLYDKVWPMLEEEDLTELDILKGQTKEELRGIGLTAGHATKLLKRLE